jgi:hypothetical protein
MVGNGGKEDIPEWCQFLADDDIFLMIINDKNSLSGGMIMTGITHNDYQMWA